MTKPKVKKIKAWAATWNGKDILICTCHTRKAKTLQICRSKKEAIEAGNTNGDFMSIKIIPITILVPLPTPKKSNSKPTKRGGRK